ncbi:MAG: histidinol-phosphate transaminase [Fibrobacter sp.]|jgi:histidinol-phosphate aminotransferase|nr:histidinol-phosphate transaminase [Fibrobacter sp.]
MLETRPELQNLSDYVPGKSIEEVKTKYNLSNVIKLASNENPLGPSPKAQAAYLAVSSKLHLYPRGDAPDLIQAIAQKHSVSKHQIILGNGSDEVIDMVGKAFIRPEDECLSLEPTFSVYRFVALSFGAKYITVPALEEDSPLEALLKKVSSKTRVIFICNPNNPTGSYFSQRELLDFIKQIPPSVLIFVDEAYAEYAQALDYPHLTPYIQEYPNLVISRTFSKIYALAGLRVGYAISSPQVIAGFWKVKPPFDINIAAQASALAAISDTEHVQKSIDLNNKGLVFVTQKIKALGFQVLSSQANFLCVRIGSDASNLVNYLESQGVIVRGLSSFGMPEWIRVTIGTPEENDFFIKQFYQWNTNARN